MDVKEILSKMKPEHAEVIQAALDKVADDLKEAQEQVKTITAERDTATKERDDAKEECNAAKDELATANEDLETTKSELETLRAEKAGAGISMDETATLKSMPTEVREIFEKMRTQKDAAEEELRKAKDAEKHAEAVAKANTLKALPIEHEKLVGIVKNADADVMALLENVSAALEGTVLDEVGKSHTGGNNADAWTKIEAKADEIVKSKSVTKAKAISLAIKENPELYKEYLNGGV